MHTISISFVRLVKTCRRWQTRRMEREGGVLAEFQEQLSGLEANEKAGRIQVWRYVLDWQLADKLTKDRPILF